ncbi:MAG TPA: ArsC/Spx/MgsR family protein [Tahibacter sp.]|uniref:arsenate reductase family protein n=1 Tax=Tahibacter sp. TaxID=2056211 RepID=UPI002CDD3783|nr:ArsC/Spx/MgsR family protein [Tahibacter sp.]HSX60986.1 ArsC/Spx/MgsR family protein [Tahibacter sp.]
MTDCTVYYNPDCSKCRALLALLEERAVDARLVDYRRTPPSAADLANLVALLGAQAGDLLRRDDPAYATLGIESRVPDAGDIVGALVRHPQLMQRPVVVRGARALIARPPERALELF